ncbi:serine/threonine-protein kinase [Micromonospora auratinigra]|uniref:serine/threonine-protein kinase n=1 Tax=Micromonospora auratinigra TaxID=261654 RepID=UPI000B8A519D|nr:serine/threonine-protein kinase [Micromonospora auratinigra]
MLTRGVLLGDRYRLDDRIATGGMGAVWKCTDTLLDREVAVKVLLPALVADPEFTTRFHAEARMLAALRHPGIVQVHDFGSAVLTDGSRVSYLVMEYVDGEPLVTWIRRAGRLDPASTMSVVAQAARALHTAHLAGIVHRDVKPGNLLVKRDGTVVLVDFGIARASATAGITAAHTVLGTASFMSPEQAVGQPVSAVTDVYALGAVAYFCLSGRPPFEGDNPLQVALRHAQEEPAPLPPDTPPAVAEVVRHALAKSPRDRHRSALALAEAAQDARDATLARLSAPPLPPWAVAGPAVPGPAVLPTPAGSRAGGPTATPVGFTPGGPAATPPGFGSGGPGSGPAGFTPGRSVAAVPGAVPPPVGPAWSVGAGGSGAEAERHAGSGVPATMEERGRRGRGRTLALAAAGVVLVALATAGAVTALNSPDDPVREQPQTLTGESVPAAPTGSVSSGRRTPRPTPSRPGRPSRSASPGPTAPASGAPSTGAADPTVGASGGPAPASGSPAAAQPYTARQVCGGGYQVLDSATLTANGVRQGRVYLLYDAASGTNCVVTLKDREVGRATTMSAFLEVQGKARRTASGAYQFYAGPVRAAAAGVCVKWGGSTGGAAYGSAFEHCD